MNKHVQRGQIMNILTGIVPTAELQDAAALATNYQAKYDVMQEHLAIQRATVIKLSLELRDLVLAKKWTVAGSHEAAAEARQECTIAADRYQEEQDILDAIEMAARNARSDVSLAGRRVFTIISQLVSYQFEGAVIEGTFDEAAA